MERPKLLDRMRAVLRTRLHGKKHPSAMGSGEVNEFLTHLAVARQVSASTQSQALAAILFLYREVVCEEVPWLTELVRAPRRDRTPVVLTREEVRRLLGEMSGTAQLVARCSTGRGCVCSRDCGCE